MAKLFQTLCSLQNGTDAVGMGLGIELVCIADNLLLQGLRDKILMGQRQLLSLDVSNGQSCSGMPFADACMAGKSLCPQQFCPDIAMTYIGFCTRTIDRRCMTAEDTDVVQHGSLFQKLYIHGQFLVFSDNSQTAVGYLSAML